MAKIRPETHPLRGSPRVRSRDAKEVNAVNERGMSALHIAVGQNDLLRVRSLVQRGAKFFPDHEGRWPSTIAALMEVDDDLLDYVAETEERKADTDQ